MTDYTHDLAITIVNWNVRELLLACLDSVQADLERAGLRGEIWVVDNASADGSVEAVAAAYPDVRLIASPANLFFGGGQNLALHILGLENVTLPSSVEITANEIHIDDAHLLRPPPIRPRYVLILNPDTTIREGALAEMVRFMDQHSQAGVCGPRLVYGDGGFQHSAYRFPTLAQTLLDFWPINWRLTDSALNGRYAKRLYQGDAPFPIDHPLGAAMLFRSEVIAQTGGFDLDYRMYVEEIEWCMRVRRAGWNVFCLPRAVIVHYEGQSTRQVRPQMVVELWKSRYRLFGQHYSALYRWLVRRLIRAGMRQELARTRQRLVHGELDEEQAQSLLAAYEQVMVM